MARQRKIDIDRARDMLASGATFIAIAKHFEVSPQAVSKAFKQAELADADSPRLPPWPWRIAGEHINSPSSTYKLMQAYRKHDAGMKVSEYELRDAKALQKFADRINGAISYDRDEGFVWVSRRADDGDKMFVSR